MFKILHLDRRYTLNSLFLVGTQLDQSRFLSIATFLNSRILLLESQHLNQMCVMFIENLGQV